MYFVELGKKKPWSRGILHVKTYCLYFVVTEMDGWTVTTNTPAVNHKSVEMPEVDEDGQS